jgi:hypothetical protein
MNACFLIPEQNLTSLQERIQKLTRRAEKLGIDPVSIHVIKQIEIPAVGAETPSLHSWVEVCGTAPKIDGYQFMGSIEFMGELAMFQAAGGGKTELIDPKYWLEPTDNCDHCKTNRRRKNLYIVREDKTGKTMQIGKNCMADFVRSPDHAQKLAAYETMLHNVAELLDDENGAHYHNDAEDMLYDLAYYLDPAAMLVRHYGWVSMTKERESHEADGPSITATYSHMAAWLNPRTNYLRRWARELVVEEQDKICVRDALAWLSEQPTDNEYFYKLRRIVDYGYCNRKNAGLLISLIGSYKSYLAREATKQPRTPVPVSDTRIHVRGKILKTDVKQNGYGFREVMTLQDDRGFILWGSIPNSLEGASPNDHVEFVAKIEVSDRDECFGFFKRPTRARLVKDVD